MNLDKYIKENFAVPIGVNECRSVGFSQPYLHWHPHYEILIILSGNYEIRSNAFTYKSSTPAVFIHPPFSLHRIQVDATEVYRRYIIHIERQALTVLPPSLCDLSVFGENGLLRLDPSRAELDELVELCKRLIPRSRNGMRPERVDLPGAILCTALVMNLVGKIYRDGRCELAPTGRGYIEDVLRLVAENLSERLTIADVSERFSIGRTKLAEDFKKATGLTFKRYITDLKQTRAREFLEAGLSIIDVSLECGYSSEAHFIKAFREYWGMTPGEFRAMRGAVRMNQKED